MAHSVIATAADYADAMMSARRAKNWLFILLLLTLVGQVGIFLMVRYEPAVQRTVAGADRIVPATQPESAGAAATTTQSLAVAEMPPVVQPSVPVRAPEPASRAGLRYLVGFSTFLGLVFTVLLGCVLLLIVLIMLVGRLIGVSRLTSAFIWCVILGFMLFPWQAFLNWRDLDREMRIPGVLYTYQELTESRVTDRALDWNHQAMLWSRFVVFPVVALILLLMIQAKGSRGLRLALGESEIEHDEAIT